MKWITLSALLVAACHPSLQANDIYRVESYYSGNHWSPYPPACITVPLRQMELYGDNVALFYDGTVLLALANKVSGKDPYLNYTKVPMKMYRVGCAEENRSVILVEFRLADSASELRAGQIEVPDLVGSAAFHGVPFILNPEPNLHGLQVEQMVQSRRTFGDYTGGWSDAGYFAWRFVLDISAFGHWWGPWLSDYYNERFAFQFMFEDFNPAYWPPFEGASFEVPSTRSVLVQNPVIPLNGRLSGNWIETGTRDQGFLLSISTQATDSLSDAPPENADLLVFLAWYTFDSNDEMLWLTASASATQGSSAVDLQFVQVTNGQFLGERRADRSFVGNGRLQAKNCNLLELDYDLSELGLGEGKVELNRIFALEIAGYHCRDHSARLESLNGKESN